ncbi:MAG: NUDIX domain-containing protein [Terriglobales bacterium]
MRIQPRIAVKAGAVEGSRRSVRQQVAAICYRAGAAGIEFLLVRTRGGRWIFPKGGVEPGLTQAQSAALEAFEEAGVHGRIEEMPFARYRLAKSSESKSPGKRSRRDNGRANESRREPTKSRKTTDPAVECETVTAHLCEVAHLEEPQEAYRTPTWFSPPKAKRRLTSNRNREFGAELANIVDRAVSRIRRLEASASREFADDALRKVRFEACETLPAHRGANFVARSLLIEARGARPNPAIELEPAAPLARRKTNYVQ